MGVVLSVTLAALVLGSAVVASHRARLAADLAALAGAGRAQTGAACAEAGRVAARNGATLVSCSVEGSDVLLVVSVDAGLSGQATARSRAGPPR